MGRFTGSPDEGLPVLYPGLDLDPWKKPTQRGFEGDLTALYALMAPTRTARALRPASDLSNSWVASTGAIFPNRYTAIDEVSPDDSDYISQGVGGLGAVWSCRCAGYTVWPAGSGVSVFVRVRQVIDAGPPDNTFSVDLTFPSGHGLHVITAMPGIGTGFQTIGRQLTGSEVASLQPTTVGQPQLAFFAGGTVAHSHFDVSWAVVNIT